MHLLGQPRSIRRHTDMHTRMHLLRMTDSDISCSVLYSILPEKHSTIEFLLSIHEL